MSPEKTSNTKKELVNSCGLKVREVGLVPKRCRFDPLDWQNTVVGFIQGTALTSLNPRPLPGPLLGVCPLLPCVCVWVCVHGRSMGQMQSTITPRRTNKRNKKKYIIKKVLRVATPRAGLNTRYTLGLLFNSVLRFLTEVLLFYITFITLVTEENTHRFVWKLKWASARSAEPSLFPKSIQGSQYSPT